MKSKFMSWKAILFVVFAISTQATAVNFYYGAMGSGKTAKLLQMAADYENNNFKTLVLGYSPHSEDETVLIKSRTGLQRVGIAYNDDTNLKELILKSGVKAVFVDEAQFLLPNQVREIAYIADHTKIKIHCFGLTTDFTGSLFDGSKELLALANKKEEMFCLCYCGKQATMNARINQLTWEISRTGAIVDMEKSQYVPLCRKHFFNGEWKKDGTNSKNTFKD